MKNENIDRIQQLVSDWGVKTETLKKYLHQDLEKQRYYIKEKYNFFKSIGKEFGNKKLTREEKQTLQLVKGAAGDIDRSLRPKLNVPIAGNLAGILARSIEKIYDQLKPVILQQLEKWKANGGKELKQPNINLGKRPQKSETILLSKEFALGQKANEQNQITFTNGPTDPQQLQPRLNNLIQRQQENRKSEKLSLGEPANQIRHRQKLR